MSHLRVDYLKLKQASISLQSDDLSKADQCFAACTPTSKTAFNRGVLRIWAHDFEGAKVHFKDSFRLDKYLSVSALYLGCLMVREGPNEAAVEWFRNALIGFRNCVPFIDYTQIGMPFVLHREDVQFNIASILYKLCGETSELFIESIKCLSLDSIRYLLGKENCVAIREPPWIDQRMIFNLLPNLEVEPIELRGPEHVGLLEGERYLGGFEDAAERTSRLNSLKSEDPKPIEITYTEIAASATEVEEKKLLFYIDQNGVKLPVSNQEVLNYAMKNKYQIVE